MNQGEKNVKVQLQQKSILRTKGGVAVVGCFEGTSSPSGILAELDRKLNGAVRKLLRENFNGKTGESFLMCANGHLPFNLLLLIGLGKEEKFHLNQVRGAAGAAIKAAKRCKAKEIIVSLASLFPGRQSKLEAAELVEAVADAAVMANFVFDKYKSKKDEDNRSRDIASLILSTEGLRSNIAFLQRGIQQAVKVAESANFARVLANEPSNVMTPAALAKAAMDAVKGMGIRCVIRDERWLRQQGMNTILAVAQGSENPPRFVILEYNPDGVKGEPIALVGKGVSFDSGGISIKPSEGMEKMKYDMSGGAAVIAAVQALAKLGIRQKVVGLVPFVENMPSGSAQRPGDVIKTYSGKYVEVLNTDAEGRLILADALAYAQNFKPKAIIDLATLTGACVVALGHEAIGMMGTDDALKARLKEAGEKTGERVWELPLWEEYFEAVKSEVADIKNVGARGAGTITAAMFLKEFVGDYPWVHLDIAGTAWVEKGSHPYLNPGPSGVGVRLLVEAIRNW